MDRSSGAARTFPRSALTAFDLSPHTAAAPPAVNFAVASASAVTASARVAKDADKDADRHRLVRARSWRVTKLVLVSLG